MRKLLPIVALALMGGCFYRTRRIEATGPEGPALTKTDLERLASAGVSDPVVTELLDRRGAAKLSAEDVVALKKAGASDAAVQKALASERKEPEAVAVAEPIYYYHSYYPCFWWYPAWYWHPSVSFGYTHWGRRSRVGIGFGW